MGRLFISAKASGISMVLSYLYVNRSNRVQSETKQFDCVFQQNEQIDRRFGLFVECGKKKETLALCMKILIRGGDKAIRIYLFILFYFFTELILADMHAA